MVAPAGLEPAILLGKPIPDRLRLPVSPRGHKGAGVSAWIASYSADPAKLGCVRQSGVFILGWPASHNTQRIPIHKAVFLGGWVSV